MTTIQADLSEEQLEAVISARNISMLFAEVGDLLASGAEINPELANGIEGSVREFVGGLRELTGAVR
jgi:hypothetical protein